MESTLPNMLTNAECKLLIVALSWRREGLSPAGETAGAQVLDWAETTRRTAAGLDLVLRGLAYVTLEPDGAAAIAASRRSALVLPPGPAVVPPPSGAPWVTEPEVQRLIAQSRPPGGGPLLRRRVIAWAENTRIDAAVLRAALAGGLVLDVEGDQVVACPRPAAAALPPDAHRGFPALAQPGPAGNPATVAALLALRGPAPPPSA